MHRFNGYDIELTQGDTLFFKIRLEGRSFPEGSVGYFTVKKSPQSDEFLIHKKLDASDGVLDIRLTSAQTALPACTYYWDVRVLIPLESGGYEVETPMEYATLTILEAIGPAGDAAEPAMDADLPVLSVLVGEARALLESMKNFSVPREQLLQAVEKYLLDNPVEVPSIAVDSTLSMEGQAADAMSTGEGFLQTQSRMDALSGRAFSQMAVQSRFAESSGGHVQRIPFGQDQAMEVYRMSGGAPALQPQPLSGSGMIACPKNLFLLFSDDSARCYLNFYTRQEDGTFVPDWSILQYEDSSKNLNKISSKGNYLFRDLPQNTFMRVAVIDGNVDLYAWDGMPCGLSVSADTAIITTSGTSGNLFSSGTGSITVPCSTRVVIANASTTRLRATIGVKNGEITVISTSSDQLRVLPQGYDYFRIRVDGNEEQNTTRTGDASDRVSVLCEHTCMQKPAAQAARVIESAKEICSLQWTPAAEIKASDGSSTFKPGVRYNGPPYGSGWSIPNCIGWHVSPHTFINAANDPDSIFYKEKGEDGSPYYATVCSTFATMAAGWPYPANNQSFPVDPRVERTWTTQPPIGMVWSDIHTHCVIPERIDDLGESGAALSAYESIRTLSMRTTRYSAISRDEDRSPSKILNGKNYYDGYGLAVRHIDAVPDLSQVPYWKPAEAVITGGDARPYRGDKSTYTSDMDAVLINIKNAQAQTLYLTDSEGVVQSVAIGGRTQVDVKPLLSKGGIYLVHADTSVIAESFEYVIPQPITYSITDGKLSFSRNDFWYAWTSIHFDAAAHPYRPAETTRCNVPAHADGDYSDWEAVGTPSHVVAVFARGEYGAYTIPFSKA